MLRSCMALSRQGPASLLSSTLPRLSPALLSIQVQPHPSQLQCLTSVRFMGFYNTGDASGLWKAMAGVSAQGKKRGRARNSMKKKNLNAGKRIGYGRAKLTWPGLTGSVITGSGKESMAAQIEPMAEKVYVDYQTELEEVRKKNSSFTGRRNRIDPLDRGWTGAKAPGRKYGAPEAANKELTFDNFNSVLLEYKTVFNMTGNMGRTRRNSILMVTGNGAGAVGYTLSPGKYGQNAQSFRRAVNKAGLRLVNVERYEDRTVYHDFFTQYGKTRIFVKQQPPGTGVVAHRVIRAICEMAGIKDLYAVVEGSKKNVQHITKAFFLGLLRQKTHQVLADEKKLHLVEMRAETDFFPRVVATPSDGVVRTKQEIGHNEILDYEMICYEGNLPQWRESRKNPWLGTPAWDKHLRTKWAYQSHPEVRLRMRVENGDEVGSVRSHLYEKYPECVERDWKKYIRMWREKKQAGMDD